MLSVAKMMGTFQLRVMNVCYIYCITIFLESVALEGHKNLLGLKQLPITTHKTSVHLLSRDFNTKTSTEDATTDKFSQGSSRLFHINDTLHQCCVKGKHIIPIGFDFTGNRKYVDIGRCRRRCRHKLHHHLRHRKNLTQGNHISLDDMITETVFQKCSSADVCEPSSRKMEIHHSLTGLLEVVVIEDCQCSSNPSSCQRVSSMMTFFHETPFESTVDVGSCQGQCGDGNSCKPLRNRTVSINGPNGASCVPVIEECQCAQPCYRMEFLELYYEHVWNDTRNMTEEGVKEIDVGRCIGGCSHLEQDRFHCVLRDEKNQEKCLMSLQEEEPLCAPVQFNTHVFTTRTGAVKSVLSIEDCACQ
ncbi:uncharacterized protein LOC111088016 [Limulus polyphemus]|uniref:Uncharacterized protein LOC111088016 n=1 Tax=Limulus polyphemus TaxID=6850 RepID=A0ABM1T989_LIMPO|nr:uncharacterized protein LOC111088016 [Limulus polyphemus]